MRRTIPLLVALTLAGTTLVAGSVSTSNAVEAAAQAKPVRTDYAMTAASYGSRVIGGALPVGSSETGYTALSCTNKAPVTKTNHIAAVNLPGLGTLKGVESKAWTTKVGGTVSSYASHDVAHINIFNNDLGSLDINGLSSLARAWHDGSGYHASYSSKIASITYTPNGGKPVGLTVPTVGKPLTIPGLLRLSIGVGHNPTTATGAQAVTSALDIRVFPGGGANEVKAIVGQTKATIGGGLKDGIYTGSAVGAQASVLGNLVNVGQTPIEFMPCVGTFGKPLFKETAGVNIAGLLKVSGLYAGVQSAGNNKKSTATSASGVAQVDIGNGKLVINGIRSVATVTRVGSEITRSTTGTKVLEILVDGEPTQLPLEDLDIPGLAELEENIVETVKNGLKVVALRIHLLDGSLAVIDLGTSIVGIKGAGKH